MNHLIPFASTSKSFVQIPDFPSVKRDLAFVLDAHIEYRKIEEAITGAHELLEAVEVFDVYQGKGIEEGKKSMALHLSFRAPDRTLSSKEIDEVLSTIRDVLEKEFSVTIRL